jgi:hypothetical protein
MQPRNCHSREISQLLFISFSSSCAVVGKKYVLLDLTLFGYYREKNKRRAEQGAALVCLCAVGVVDIHTLIRDGSIR